MPSVKEISSSTQLFTEIFDIVDNMVVTSKASVSMVIEISTINFGLLAEDEQDGAIYAYAALLNALNFPIQILIQSQTKDISRYLYHLQDMENEMVSPVKKRQIARYREFVGDLVHEANVLDKKFYAVITALNTDLGLISAKTFLPWQKEEVDLNKVDRVDMNNKAAAFLEPKRDQLMAAFGRIGLSTRQLSTQELVKLFYTNYNYADSEGVEIGNTEEYTTPIVTTSIR